MIFWLSQLESCIAPSIAAIRSSSVRLRSLMSWKAARIQYCPLIVTVSADARQVTSVSVRVLSWIS
jgi:hypothetical protein